MTENADRASIWDHLDELSDGDRKALVDSAVAVLSQDLQPADEITADMPASLVSGRMADALSAAGLPASQQDASAAMSAASGDDAVATMLSSLSQVPGLREEIEAAYRRRQEMLFLDMGVITGPALLILLLKLKHIKIGSSGADIEFYDAHDSAIELVRRMLGI
jgi:hypothetical protein